MFKRPKYKRYEYKPRYFDAEKQEREARFKFALSEAKREKRLLENPELAGELDGEPSFTFRSQYESRRAKRQSGLRLLVILMVLLAICWVVLSDLNLLSSTSKPDSNEPENLPAEVHDILN